jgi:O-acetyl-ADP-ribose deacetylase (regulator of RNase III)
VESLRIAAEHGIATIAFPAISTGVYGYPMEEACGVAMDAVLSWLRDNEQPREVTFCCFQRGTAALYRELLRRAAL